ncbi:putative phosphoribosyl-ATP pyrophosphohydrolase [Bacillus cereus ATCC 4342]|uniref:nucleoside triphosphate pyrophosphohydrolase n=1 Tax=Bacillus tropicus TaxID=2026188 RepID=UPI0001A01C8F|nr:nucleoside triphosphate pyrophosphohydrolase [Bacillus tropicus]AJH72897.1 putative phosphoribosyl-ATP pyrophosphohydrolase [Bacillus cereus ATCC 4342]EEK85720.1 Phosphoribosyl-ATP pyrophosphohydrolase [Bacillus cereus ATCC 4342]KFM87203.1 putative phosphoribosyl-ATP pyrophosphohydrolase [Bacillus cereus ATCC 4342]MDR4453809.1 phosphoribosyl-ATP pyrophosphohydrolase [Bacillus tropicus]QKH54095.1 nucleoside triphosphate pyrophosphohydrolase [Bacillus tropicus]
MPTYNKLVRDRIPEIIENNGKTFTTRILNEKEYIEEVSKKTQEELAEYLEAESKEHKVEELADLLELVNALAQYEGVTLEDVEQVRKQKAEKRGGFQERVFLVEVHDD